MILHYFKLLPYNVVSSWHSGGMIGTQWTMRSNQSEHAENQRKTMFSSKGPLDTPFHHLLLLETNEHKFVPDLLIMCTTERITSVLHWCMCTKTVYHVFWWWKFYCSRVFPGVAPLTKNPEDSRYKVVYDFNVYNRPVGCMLRIAEIKVTAFTHIHTLTSNTKSYKLCYIILLFWNTFAKPLSNK